MVRSIGCAYRGSIRTAAWQSCSVRENGYWRIAPSSVRSATRRYRPGTLILETTFTTEHGCARVVDFMPPKTDRSRIIRIVEGVSGEVEMHSELKVRFDYGITIPWASRIGEGGVSFVAGAALSSSMRMCPSAARI